MGGRLVYTPGIGPPALWVARALVDQTEQIDTTTSGGKLIFHVFGALAEFERDVIRERTAAGLAAARARNGGHPRAVALNDPKKVAMA
jgi:DNA invertase Pin-like site-specific DNA recombinase